MFRREGLWRERVSNTFGSALITPTGQRPRFASFTASGANAQKPPDFSLQLLLRLAPLSLSRVQQVED